LYGAVHARARHAGPRFGAGHFVELAAAMAPADYELVGYFEDGALVGWNSRFRAGDDVTSSFFGFERPRGDALGLFRNLLLDDLEHALATGARRVHFGRTTHAIKSELGAVPEPLPCFVRPLSPLARPLCWAARSLYRAPAWTPRNPFAGTGAP
ncbi:MAG: GNAT family N-acetyltransferase, partial [Deltaproteobacteria bacterium]|nr:GNAT family N-acetyltransferase [Kofleriaceae bacterium]